MLKINCVCLVAVFCFLTSCHSEHQQPRTLRLNMTEGDFSSLQPHELQGHIRGRTMGKLLFESLTRLSKEGEAELAGAEKVEISPNGKEYLFTLRPHVWSDGTPVTAAQYAATWKHLLRPGSDCSWAHLLYVIKNARLAQVRQASLEEIGIQAVDDRTLLVTLEHPAPFFLELVSHPVFAPLQQPGAEPICFNGPFVLDGWEKGTVMHLKPNRYFWDAQNVHLDGVTVFFIHDFATSYLMFEKNQIDWVGNPFCRLTTEDMGALKEKGELIEQFTTRPLWIFFNTEKLPFTAREMRCAFSLAIDRQLLTDHILVEDNPLFTPLPIQLSLLQPALTYSLEEARAHFEKGLEELGMTREDLPPLEIGYQDSHKQLVTMLKEIWEKAFGVSVSLKGTDWNVLKSELEKGNFLMASYTSSSFLKDPLEMLERFEQINTNNLCRWVDPHYQELIASARVALDPATRTDLLREAEGMLVQEMPFIPIANRNHAFAYPKTLKGVTMDSSGSVDFRWAYWES